MLIAISSIACVGPLPIVKSLSSAGLVSTPVALPMCNALLTFGTTNSSDICGLSIMPCSALTWPPFG